MRLKLNWTSTIVLILVQIILTFYISRAAYASGPINPNQPNQPNQGTVNVPSDKTLTANNDNINHSAQSRTSNTIRVAILPFYSKDTSKQPLAKEAHMLVASQLNGDPLLTLVSKYIITPTFNQHPITSWYPEVSAHRNEKQWNSLAWKTGAQVIISGQVITPLIFNSNKKKTTQPGKPVLILTARSTETGKIITVSMVENKSVWANKTKELADQMAVELNLTGRGMTIAKLLKSEYVDTPQRRNKKIKSTDKLVVFVMPNHRITKKKHKSKQLPTLLQNTITGFSSLGVTIATNIVKRKTTIIAMVSLKSKTLKSESGIFIRRKVITLKLIKTNDPHSNIILHQYIYHNSTLKHGINLLTVNAVTALLQPKQTFPKYTHRLIRPKTHNTPSAQK